jgi:uncharacterized OB-fold protein
MTLLRCRSCARRYATPLRWCRRCGGEEFEPVALAEQATVAATTTVHVPEGSRHHLVIAELADLAVLARTDRRLDVGARIDVSDAPGGGFVAMWRS